MPDFTVLPPRWTPIAVQTPAYTWREHDDAVVSIAGAKQLMAAGALLMAQRRTGTVTELVVKAARGK